MVYELGQNDVCRAILAMTRDLGLYGFIRQTVPISGLLRLTRDTKDLF